MFDAAFGQWTRNQKRPMKNLFCLKTQVVPTGKLFGIILIFVVHRLGFLEILEKVDLIL